MKDWINVNDMLPNGNKPVIVCDITSKNIEVFMAFYSNNIKLWSMNAIPFKVTHWMPIPEPPETIE